MTRNRQPAAPKPGRRPIPAPSRATGAGHTIRAVLVSPWFLAGLYLLVTLPWFLAHRIGRYDVETDFFGEYAPHAALFRSGQIPETFPYRGPGYHIVLALAGLFVSDAFLAGKLLSLLSGAAFIALLAWWVARRAGGAAGVVAALLAAVQPLTSLYGWTVGNDMFFAALVMATVALIDRSLDPTPIPTPDAGRIRSPGPLLPLAAGFMAGYAGLTRPNGIILVPAGLVAAFLLRPRTSPLGARRFALLFLGGWLLPTFIWSVTFHAAHRHWPESMNFRNMTEALFEEDARVSVDVYRQTIERHVGGFSDFLRLYGDRLPRVVATNVPKHLLSLVRQVHGVPISLLALVGLVLLLVRRPPRGFWILPMTGLLVYLLLLLAIDEARYSLLLAAPVAALAAVALFDPRDGMPRRLFALGLRARAALVLLVVLGVAVPTLLWTLKQNRDWLFAEQIVRSVPRAADYLKTLKSQPGPVAARKPHIAFWSGRPYRGLPAVPLAELADSLRSCGAVFLYYGQVELEMQPQLYPLLTPDGIPPGLQLVYVYDAIPVGAIFRVLPRGATAPPLSADIRAALGRLNASLDASGIASRIQARHATDLMQRAKLLLEQGQLEPAFAEFEKAVRLRPDLKEAQYGLGAVGVMTGQWSRALQALQAAQDLGVPEEELTLYMGQALYGMNRPDEGADKAQRFLARKPGDPLGLFLLAACRESQGRLAEAADLIRKARAAGFPEPGEIDALEERVRRRLGH